MRGTYHYALDGKPDVVLEEWSRRASGGGVVTRVTRRSETFGAFIEVEVAEQPDLIEATFDWRNSSPNAVPVARATYRLHNGQLSVTRSLPADDSLTLGSVIGGDPVLRPNLDFPTQTYPIPPNAIFFPLMRIFTGKVIKHVAQSDGATVIVPNIKDPTQPHELLTPIFEQRTAKRIGSETLTLYKRSTPTQVYQYIGGNYDDAARFWLDSNDVLIRYSFQNWDVTLERG